MKKKSLSAKKTIHKQLLSYLNNKKINKIFSYFQKYLKFSINKKTKIGVAISGGADSLALAFLTKCYSLKNKSEVKYFIVDHKLRKESLKEAKSIKLLLKKFDINCDILKWYGKKPISNIQGIARNNRYRLLVKACFKNKINSLLIGHHIDDLYENFFIRLLRGSGLKGLSSFGDVFYNQKKDIQIIRPLLKFEKVDLIYISKIIFKFYVKDPSNENVMFKRIRIRKLISNFNEEGLDKKKLNLTINNLKMANNAINFYVEKNIQDNSTYYQDKNFYILNKLFFEQPEEVIFRSFSLVLKKISGNYYSPRGKSIYEFISKINGNKFYKSTLGGCYVKKFNETILITREKRQ